MHLYQGADIKQDQFINQVHKRHEQGVVFHIASQDKSTDGNERQRSNSDQSLITNIAFFLCRNDNDDHIGQHVEIQQNIPQDMPRAVRRHIAAKAVQYNISYRFIEDIAKAHRARKSKYKCAIQEQK